MKPLACILVVAATGCLIAPGEPQGQNRAFNSTTDVPSPGPMHGARLTFDPMRNAVVLYTGRHGDNLDGKLYARHNGQWTEICGIGAPAPVYLPGLAFDARTNELILAGGFYSPTDLSSVRVEVWACDQLGLWSQKKPLEEAVGGATLVWRDLDKQFVLVGGHGATDEYQGIQISSDFSKSWVTAAMSFPSSSAGVNATFSDDDQSIYALPGALSDISELHDEIYRLPPGSTTWTSRCNNCSGVPRVNASIAHVGNSQETYVVGGFIGGGHSVDELQGTWVLDHDSLVEVFDNPSSRDSVGLTWNADTDTLVGYGGNGGGCAGNPNSDCNDTLELTETP